MRLYLKSQGRNLAQMTSEESSMYQAEQNNQSLAGTLIQDCLSTLAQFCHSMPLDWIFGSRLDFVGAMLHLLREPLVHLEAITCLENLALRKLDAQQWTRLVSSLPSAVASANGGLSEVREEMMLEQQVGGDVDQKDPLAIQLPYHRALSRMLAHTVSTNISHVSTDKNLVCLCFIFVPCLMILSHLSRPVAQWQVGQIWGHVFVSSTSCRFAPPPLWAHLRRADQYVDNITEGSIDSEF